MSGLIYMKISFSKALIKSVDKLSGKMKESLREALLEVEQAHSLEDITDCKKIGGLEIYLSDPCRKLSRFFVSYRNNMMMLFCFSILFPEVRSMQKETEKI